jgi:hypothetical protein
MLSSNLKKKITRKEQKKKKTDVLPALESASASELKIHAESQPYTTQNILQQQQQQKTPKRLNAAATPPTETPQTPPQPPLKELSLAVANPVADAAAAVSVDDVDKLPKFLQRPTPE